MLVFAYDVTAATPLLLRARAALAALVLQFPHIYTICSWCFSAYAALCVAVVCASGRRAVRWQPFVCT